MLTLLSMLVLLITREWGGRCPETGRSRSQLGMGEGTRPERPRGARPVGTGLLNTLLARPRLILCAL